MSQNLPSVITTDTDIAQVMLTPPPIALDDQVDLIRLEELLRKTIKEHEEELKKVQARIQELMGDAESATIDGEEVYTWKRIDGLNETNFRKAYPALAKAYTDLVEKPVLNKDLLRQSKPLIFREFQTRQFKRVG